MKSAREYIKNLTIDKSNLQYIANTGVVNGSLLIDLEKAMKGYAKEVAREALKNASENADVFLDANDNPIVIKSTILDESNIPQI